MRGYRAKKAVVVDMTLNTITLKIEGGEKQKVKSRMFDLLLGTRCQVTIDSRTGRIREVIKEGVHSTRWPIMEETEAIPMDEYEESMCAQELDYLEMRDFEDWE